MSWTFAAEEWLVDFTASPRGRPHEGPLDEIDRRVLATLVWEQAPKLVMPSIVPKRTTIPPLRAAGEEGAPAAPQPQHQRTTPPQGSHAGPPEALEVQLSAPKPPPSVFIPALTRASPPTAFAAEPEPPPLEFGLPDDDDDDLFFVAKDPPAPATAAAYDDDEPEPEAEPVEPVEPVAAEPIEPEPIEPEPAVDDDDEPYEEGEVEVVEVSAILHIPEPPRAPEPPPRAPEPPPRAPEPPPRAPPRAAPAPPPRAAPPRPPERAERKSEPRRRGWYDDVFGEHYPYIMPRDADVSAEADVEFMVQSAKLRPDDAILDVGCGDGRHLFAFAKAGFGELTGLDSSLAQLILASRRNESSDAGLTFLHGDMRELPTDRSYDAVLCLGTTFGYFEDEPNRLCLQDMAERLSPGGRLVLQVMNRDHMMSIVPCRSWWQGRGCLVLDVAEMNFFSNRLRVHRTIVFEDGRQFEHNIFVRAYNVNEIGKLVTGLGLKILDVSGSRDTPGRFFGAASPDIWISAQRT
jgi:SAM-dependent methyltransferase